MQSVYTQVDSCALTGLDNLIVELLLNLSNNLFDTCRVDTSVANQLMESQTTYLTTNWIETRDYDSLRSIVYYDFNACSCLESTDVTTLATDDTTLYFVVLDVEYAYGVLDGGFGSYTLDSLYNDLLGLSIGVELSLVHNLVDIAGGGSLSLVLHRLYQAVLCLFGAQA